MRVSLKPLREQTIVITGASSGIGLATAKAAAEQGARVVLTARNQEAPISVTLIKPTSINTPFPQHARNYQDREPQVPPPVYQPDEVAQAILYAAEHPVRDIYVGSMARVMSSLGKHAPGAADWISETMMVPQEFRDESARNPDGSLYEPQDDGEVYGDHPGFVRPFSVYTRAVTHPVLTSAVVASGIAVAALTTACVLGLTGNEQLSKAIPRRDGKSPRLPR